MASEIAERNRANAEELTDMQAQYLKKRRKMVESQDQDIENLRENYARQKEEITEANEAAVNHIKKHGKETLEGLKQEAEQRVELQKEAGSQQIQNYKKYVDQNVKALDRQIGEREGAYQQVIEGLSRKEEYQRQQQQKSTSDFIAKQQAAVRKAEEASHEGIEQIYERANTKRQEVLDKNNAELKKLNAAYSETVKKETQQRSDSLDKIRAETLASLKSTSLKNQERVNQEKAYGEKNLHDIQQTFKEETVHAVQDGTQRVNTIKADNQRKMETSVLKGKMQQEKLHNEQQRQLESVHNSGEKIILEEQSKADKNVELIKQHYENELAKQKQLYDLRMNEMQDTYQKQFARNNEVQRANLERQRQQFKENYRLLEQAGKQSLNVEKEMFSKALGEMKKDQAILSEKFTSKNEDPFYRLQNRNSDFTETSNSYVLKTYIPEHEKDNVKVRVQGDKVTVAGTRAFKDELKDEDKRLSTNNYQTFKEEFAFNFPVANNSVIQERDGDYVKFVIPKLGSLNKKV